MLAGVIVTSAVAAPAHAADFLKAIDDVPLAAGLVEQPEPVVFETDQGRVVRTTARGEPLGSTVWKFYLDTLPALGWRREGETDVFKRGNEQLKIEVIQIIADGSGCVVNFELIVKLASTKLPG